VPNGRSSIRWRNASGACSSGKDRSYAGAIWPPAISGKTAVYASACSSAEAASSENPLTWASFHTRSVTRMVVSVPAA
jgi:hypothetical protein